MVDDSVDDRQLFRRALSRAANWRLEFAEANDGAEAAELFATGIELDIILLDHNLPVSSGLTLLQEWQENYPTLPAVVLLTGHGGERIAVEAMKLGALDYLSKHDCTPEELVHVVRHAAYATRLRRELAAQPTTLLHAEKQFQLGEVSGARRTVATFLHEINSPLTGILNYSRLLMDEEPAAERRAILGEIVDACQRIEGVLQRMETLDELHARPGSNRHGPIDLRALM